MDQIASMLWQSVASGTVLANLSYILLIISMLMSSLTYLRLLAIGSGICGVFYFWVFLGDRVASVWEVLFIVANLFQLALTAYRDWRSRFDPDEAHFWRTCVPSLSPSDARKLLRIAMVERVASGSYLTREKEEVRALVFVLEGEVDIQVSQAHVGSCGAGDFIGEIGVIGGTPATASAVATTPVRYIAFDAHALRKLMTRDQSIATEMEYAFRRGLREKLMRANATIVMQTPGMAGELRPNLDVPEPGMAAVDVVLPRPQPSC